MTYTWILTGQESENSVERRLTEMEAQREAEDLATEAGEKVEVLLKGQTLPYYIVSGR